MYRICINKALYSANLSFTMFIGPGAVTQGVLQNSVRPSFPLSGCFLGIGSLVFFLNLGMALENQITSCVTEPNFLRKTSFAPNTGEIDQHWAKNSSFF